MIILEIFLLSSIGILTVDLVRAEITIRKQQKKLTEHTKKLYSADRDIKTLHFNQKVLQSSIKELHRDLRVYGEVKKSRIKAVIQNREESSESF